MKVLALDTSNYVLGIALLDGNTVIGEYITNLKKNHSVRAMPAIQQLMKECEVEPKELGKIIVANGPGSYTGVRIGVTIAKTLAWTLGIPIVGVSSLEVIAANGRYFDGYISPLFDGRRGQIYTGLYRYVDGSLENVIPDGILQSSEWAQTMYNKDKPVLFIGNDLPLHREIIGEIMQERAFFASESMYNPRPSELAYLGLLKEATEVHSFVPNYVRMAEAETNWLKQQKK
ncbi:tRNA (adenosine(37)-N6)-threonylcarbamoyltransferase complex dimerization subunit type 1 TsaB [Peribacillus acanthi]|uniref:tRNA (adenosine(37)-N6)-threonylcarbamoyltransferase complex dimerization subunit type 1 TsaB n=1 Tax=Peribacillus acanthi TaxID=2171554 RepID=UPI000D3E3E1D|nr:tRNA (adenosine(37)-N6)-threonylcarbamoyltransferase complex dimerization subunit type 1 TsaB [Peribacillus acanthi]